MRVELVSKTVGVNKYESLDSEEIIAAIARHGIIKEDNGKLVRYLMTHRHWSPLDMINFNFEVETSRGISRQMIRHDSLDGGEFPITKVILRLQEHSQRYSDKVSFQEVELRREHPTNRQSSTEPFNPEIKVDVYGGEGYVKIGANEAIDMALEHIQSVYKALIEAGVAKECARNILPECTTTVLTFNGTLRNWLSFLNVRLDHNAQKEIRLIAERIGEELEQQLPNVFKTIDWKNGMFL